MRPIFLVRLKLFDFFEVPIRQIEDKKSDDNSQHTNEKWALAKEIEINRVENNPNTPPNQYNPDNNTEVFGEVTNGKAGLS